MHVFASNFGRRAEEIAEASSVSDEELWFVFTLSFAVVQPCAKVASRCARNGAVNHNAEPFVAVCVFNNPSQMSAQVSHVRPSVK